MAQSNLPPSAVLLAKIKRQAAKDLGQMPALTCVEEIQRTERPSGVTKWRLVDSLHIDVGFAADREMSSWPGGHTFSEGDVSQLVGAGLTSGGEFLGHARNVLTGGYAGIRFAGEEEYRGRTLARFDYSLASLFSGYRIRMNGASETVATRGSFLADRDSGQLTRLTLDAADIPPSLGVTGVELRVEYGTVRIGEDGVLLPLLATLTMTERSGLESRNEMTFTHCRRFASSSQLHVGDEESTVVEAGPFVPRDVTLPAGLTVEIRLVEPIRSDSASIGDPIKAVIAQDVRANGKVILPKGATVTGRVRMMERYLTPKPHFVVGLEFTEADFPGHRARLWAWMQGTDPVTGLASSLTTAHSRSIRMPDRGRIDIFDSETYRAKDMPGVGVFLLEGNSFQLPAGFGMRWQTLDFRGR